MRELPFGPFYADPSHYTFTAHYYAALSQHVNVVSLDSLEHLEVRHPEGLRPVFLRLCGVQPLEADFPIMYIQYENSEIYRFSGCGRGGGAASAANRAVNKAAGAILAAETVGTTEIAENANFAGGKASRAPRAPVDARAAKADGTGRAAKGAILNTETADVTGAAHSARAGAPGDVGAPGDAVDARAAKADGTGRINRTTRGAAARGSGSPALAAPAGAPNAACGCCGCGEKSTELAMLQIQLEATERPVAATDDYVLTAAGDLLEAGTKRLLIRGGARPTTGVVEFRFSAEIGYSNDIIPAGGREFHSFAAVGYSNNIIATTDGREFRFAQAAEVSVAAEGGDFLAIRFEIGDPNFRISCFQFYRQFLVAIMSTGHCVVLDLQSRAAVAQHLFRCAEYAIVRKTGANLDENFNYPMHCVCGVRNAEMVVTLYIVEIPVKNTYLQTTRIVTRSTGVRIEEKGPKNTDFIPFDPVSERSIEKPEFGCSQCNYGFYGAEIQNWTCCGCGGKLIKYCD